MAPPSSPSSKPATCIRSGTATSASRRSSRSPRTHRSSGAGATSSRSCTAPSARSRSTTSNADALIMAHPAFGAETTTTSTLLAAFTVLEPGDRARPHRHTGAAIRFATRADGAATIVNGRRCEMKDGDLILTPPMCWHGHINESDHRIIWFDAANMPLIRAVERPLLRAGRPAQQRVLAGRRRRGGAMDRGRPARRGRERGRGRFAEIPLSRRGDAPAARRRARRRRRHARAPLRQPRDRRRRSMATLDCYAARSRTRVRRRGPNARPGTLCASRSRRARAARPCRATRPSNGSRHERLHHPALDLLRATRHGAATRTSSW